MKLHLAALLMAVAAGTTMAVQGSTNSLLSKHVGIWTATFIVQSTATLAVLPLMLLLQPWKTHLPNIIHAPWYSMTGGLLMVVIVSAVAFSIRLVGAAPATTAIILGQIVTATIIDHFGLFELQRAPFNFLKIPGILMFVTGAWILLRTH